MNPLRAEKLRKLKALRDKGIDPYPYSFDRNFSTQGIKDQFGSLAVGEKKVEVKSRLAGRLMTLRGMGKALFFNLQDQEGSLQFYVKVEELTEIERFVVDHLDLGDWVGVEGFPFRTQKGELSVHVKSLQILCKTLEPLPEKFHGVQDIEIKYRHRHLDLLSDSESRKVFRTRSLILEKVREFMKARGFMEVETPVLQPIYGGAAAFPFTTHHRALDMKLYLKISPELYLKRLLVGGFEKVFEITKNFRNEGIDRTHNPEFTMMEWYEAYTDYMYQMQQFEDLVVYLVTSVVGQTKFQYQGKDIDFTPPWRRLSVYEGVREYAGIDPEKSSAQELFQKAKSLGSDLEEPTTHGEMVMELFDLAVEKKLWNPTFVMDHPVEISPLTKKHRAKKGLVERFEPVAAGMEIGNSFSELNDPEEQLFRLQEQEAKRVIDEEAQPMDHDFIQAIDVGMPPAGGVGLGIERIVMLLTDRNSIKDIILFPTLKHQGLGKNE